MGYYYNPANELPNVGRKLNPGSFEELTAQLQPDEGVVALGDRVIFKFAALLYNGYEYNEFAAQLDLGVVTSLDYYAVPLALFPDYQPKESDK